MDRSIPPFLRHQFGELLLWQWIGILLCLLAGLVIGVSLARVLNRMFEHLVRRTPVPWDDQIASATQMPAKLFCTLVVTSALVRTLDLPQSIEDGLTTAIRAGSIAAVVWGMIRALYAIAEAVADSSFARETIDPERLARMRSVRTQVIVATRVVSVLLFVVGSALVALQFSVVRTVGMSLLASAGVAGVVIGFAAQKSLGALLAGIQISISQPIRIGDAVSIQGEFGTIEDIGLTFVTVKLWDERRLIVPTPRFLEEPFTNLSRTPVGLVGIVFMRVDWEIPVLALRQEFDRVIALEPNWDGRVKNLQVTDAGETSLELRALVSARDPGMLWDLRVSVREKLVTWLQTFDQGAHLPRTRLVVDPADPAPELSPRAPDRAPIS